MRPHRLRLTAFGPFPGTVELDLDEVSGAGPFLLRGATGAGKTSLLDAVGYALFGRVPGSRGMKQLRSDHAPDGVRTAVELWATVGGRAVHVVRTPDQRRPRARGEGWTTDRAGVSVRVARDLAALEADECDARWSGVQEANDELANLVGMTHEQFMQVVLLPQGDFARFLRARDEERATVLRALFDTSRFAAVEQHLRRRRDETRDGLAAARDSVATAAAAVAAHAGTGEPPEEALATWAGGLLEQATRSREQARRVAAGAAAGLGEARRAHAAAEVWAGLVADLRAAATTWGDLLAREAEVRRTAAGLEAADRAAEVAGLHEEHVAARARAEDALAAARADLTVWHPGSCVAAPLPEHLDGADAAAVRPVVRELSDVLTADVDVAVRHHADLEALRRDVRRLEELVAGADAQRAALAGARDQLSRLRVDEARLPGRLAELDQELEAARGRAAGAEAAVRALERWQGLAGLAAELGTLVEQAVEAEHADLAARRAHRDAEQHLDDLREARVRGMSGELAAGLRPGVPCRVCGATEHPAPARPPRDPHDPRAEESARAEVGRLGEAAGDAAAALARLQGRCEDVRTRLSAGAGPEVEVVPAAGGGSVDTAVRPELALELDRRVQDAREELRSVRAAEAQVETTNTRLEQVRAEHAQAAEAASAVEVVHAGLLAAVDAAAQEQFRLQTTLADALAPDAMARDGGMTSDSEDAAADDPAVLVSAWAGRTRSAAARLSDLRRAAVAVDLLLAALVDAERAGGAAARAARAAGWDDTAAASAAARPRSWRDAARQQVAAHDRDLHAAALRVARLRDQLADLLTADDAGDPAGDEAAQPVADAAAPPAGDAAAPPAGDPAAQPAGDPAAPPAGDHADPRVAGLLVPLLAVAAVAGPASEVVAAPDAAAVTTLVGTAGLALVACEERERQTGADVARAEERHDEAGRELARCSVTRDGLARAVPRLLEAEAGTAPLRASAEAAKALADLCSGANDKQVPLSTYVLAAHLEHVVAAANQRLHGLSEGRYALVHVEEGEDRRRRAGLGLAVLDAWTGRQRPAGTLSGGETFLASLALALGLADVVTAEAGGVRIDALFVDEGFGTLDPDSLDRAMDVLDQLQEHGRMVGVVSHVGELAQRVPRQVLVRSGRAGSTVEVLAP